MGRSPKLPPVPPVAIHIQPLSGLVQTGSPIWTPFYPSSRTVIGSHRHAIHRRYKGTAKR
jgi:hypothetical protein